MWNMNNVTLVCDDEWDTYAHRVKLEAILGRLRNSTNVTLACDEDAHRAKNEAIHGRLSNSTNVTLACDDVLQIETEMPEMTVKHRNKSIHFYKWKYCL